MKSYRVYQVDAFTRRRFEGNPAGVVANADGMTDSQMQAIARELNNSETAFILSPTAPGHDVWVRFFTPTTEVPSCGHATISAHFVRAMENDLPSCQVQQRIGIGVLPVDIAKDNRGYKIVMTQGAVKISPPVTDQDRNDILKAINVSGTDLENRCPIQVVSTGSSKVIIGVKNREILNSIIPDMNSLANISKTIGSSGYFVFTLDSEDKDILTHGRMFAPAMGIPEDPVTGNGNGPLGAFLVHHGLLKAPQGIVSFKGKQGEAMGRPGIVEVTVYVKDGKPSKVQVGGHATVTFKTEIEL